MAGTLSRKSGLICARQTLHAPGPSQIRVTTRDAEAEEEARRRRGFICEEEEAEDQEEEEKAGEDEGEG